MNKHYIIGYLDGWYQWEEYDPKDKSTYLKCWDFCNTWGDAVPTLFFWPEDKEKLQDCIDKEKCSDWVQLSGLLQILNMRVSHSYKAILSNMNGIQRVLVSNDSSLDFRFVDLALPGLYYLEIPIQTSLSKSKKQEIIPTVLRPLDLLEISQLKSGTININTMSWIENE